MWYNREGRGKKGHQVAELTLWVALALHSLFQNVIHCLGLDQELQVTLASGDPLHPWHRAEHRPSVSMKALIGGSTSWTTPEGSLTALGEGMASLSPSLGACCLVCSFMATLRISLMKPAWARMAGGLVRAERGWGKQWPQRTAESGMALLWEAWPDTWISAPCLQRPFFGLR